MNIDRAILEAKREEYEQERANAEYTLLRVQGALIAIDDLLALANTPQAEQLPPEEKA